MMRNHLIDGPMRWLAFGMIICIGSLWSGQTVLAQAGAKKVVSEEKTLLTKSGIALKATYFPSNAGEDAPVVVLLHGKAGNRLVWKNFAGILQQNGFAAVTLDLSAHGESESRFPKSSGSKKADTGTLKPVEYKAMVADDLETVKKFLFEEHQKKQLNMAKLAIAGADFSAAVAIAYADYDWQKTPYDDAATLAARTPRGQDVKALILLSPDEHVPGLAPAQSLSRLKAIGMRAMVGVGKTDKLDKGAAKQVFDQLAPKNVSEEDQYVYFIEYDSPLRGTDLLNKPDEKVETNMYNFLVKHVKDVPVEWRDRRSRLERDSE